MDVTDLFSPPALLITAATTGHTSSETDESEATTLHDPLNPLASTARRRGDVVALEDDVAEARRKRNRESMRRVRLRKRDAKLHTQHTVGDLERRLALLLARNEQAARALAAREQQDPRATALVPVHTGVHNATKSAPPTYPELLSEIAALSYANKALRDRLAQQQVVAAALARMADEERLQQRHAQTVAAAALSGDTVELLRPLLAWLTPAHVAHMIALATAKIRANAAVVEALVLAPAEALGWRDQRCVDSGMARYVLRKSFPAATAERLAAKTWATIVDIDKLATVMRWAKGMKVLHWLSDDAAVVTRVLTIPSPLGPDVNTVFRFTLLVFRTRTRDGGYCLGTLNLNVCGTTVDECLATDATSLGGTQAHTMYGWTFTPVREVGSAGAGGCDVELAGLTGNGTLAYARNVLMEMVTVVLLWEHAFVASIQLLQP